MWTRSVRSGHAWVRCSLGRRVGVSLYEMPCDKSSHAATPHATKALPEMRHSPMAYGSREPLTSAASCDDRELCSAQQMTMTAGEEIMREMGNDAYVYKRDNGEYGLSQIWPIKLNAQFKKSFVCSTPTQPEGIQSRHCTQKSPPSIGTVSPEDLERPRKEYHSNLCEEYSTRVSCGNTPDYESHQSPPFPYANPMQCCNQEQHNTSDCIREFCKSMHRI